MLNGLRKEVKAVVVQYCVDETHGDAVLRSLGRRGFALHAEAPCRAGALSLHACLAVSPHPPQAAFRCAAGVELLMESAYVLDHVADGEVQVHDGLSPPQELALGLTLMTCGFAAISEAFQQTGGQEQRLARLQRLFGAAVGACAGQFLDARAEARGGASADEALRVASLKAGSLGRLAAEAGASLATDDEATIALLGDFGANLFTYAQLHDDLRDVCPGTHGIGDLAAKKQTLPVVAFLNSLVESRPGALDVPAALEVMEEPSQVVALFGASRVPAFCATVAEVFLNRARENVAHLRGRGADVRGLEDFLLSEVGCCSGSISVV